MRHGRLRNVALCYELPDSHWSFGHCQAVQKQDTRRVSQTSEPGRPHLCGLAVNLHLSSTIIDRVAHFQVAKFLLCDALGWGRRRVRCRRNLHTHDIVGNGAWEKRDQPPGLGPASHVGVTT